MINIYKWVRRCLGWIVLGCLALAALVGFVLDKKRGYGTMEVRAVWHDTARPIGAMASGDYELLVGGKRLAWAGGRRIRFRPGPIVAELRVKGFRPSSASLEINKDIVAVAEFRLEAEPRTVTITNVKSNGVVNGKACGGTWVLQGAEVGRSYPVEIAAPGYRTHLLNLMIEKPGDDLVTNLTWEPLMGFVRLNVSPVVHDLAASVDGRDLDPLAGGLVEVGRRTLTVSNCDYYPFVQRVEVLHGATNIFQVVLRPRPAEVSLRVTPAVRYQVIDAAGGILALQDGMVELPVGTNALTVSAKGCIPQRREFAVLPNRKYLWELELRREGLQEFTLAQADFESLTVGSRLGVLEQGGGPDWERIRATRFDQGDLVHGAQQYRRACQDLTNLFEQISVLMKEKERFQSLTNDPAKRRLLEAFGGPDWMAIRDTKFEEIDLSRGAQQYSNACAQLAAVLEGGKQRERLEAKAQAELARQAQEKSDLFARAQNDRERINRQFEGRTGDKVTWVASMNRASLMVSKYEEDYGEGTQYQQWFGSIADEVKAWRRRIDLGSR